MPPTRCALLVGAADPPLGRVPFVDTADPRPLPESSCRRRHLISYSLITFRTILPLRRWPSPQPSAFGYNPLFVFSTFGLLSIAYFLVYSHILVLYSSSPITLYIYVGWGRPTGPPACKSTSGRTFLSFSHSPLIWRFRPHLSISVNISSLLSSLAQVRACVRTARNTS